MMTARDCISERRSVRKFQESAVNHELLAHVAEAASYAPSWKNTQTSCRPARKPVAELLTFL